MLNAVKHLYRIVKQMRNGAVEMLCCAQHNSLFALVANFKYVALLCLFLATTSQAQTYTIKTLDGTDALIKVQDSTSAPSTSSPLTISYLTDKLVVSGYWASGEIKIVNRRFLQIRYHKRTGSDIAVGNILLLCVSNGKLRQAMHIESYSSDTRYVSRKDYDHAVKKIVETQLIIDAKGNVQATIYDSLIHRKVSGINKASSKKYVVNFNQKQQIFSNYQKKISTNLTVFTRKTNLTVNRHFIGSVPAFQLGEVEYIFIGRNWYAKNGRAKDYLLVN